MAWPKGKPRGVARVVSIDSVDSESPKNPEPLMKLQFAAVRLNYDLARLGGHMGLATANTSHFTEADKNTIELDCVTGLVTITHTVSGEQHIVPRERVNYFTPKKPAPAAK